MNWCDYDKSGDISLKEMTRCVSENAPKDQVKEINSMFTEFWPYLAGPDGKASREEMAVVFGPHQSLVQTKLHSKKKH